METKDIYEDIVDLAGIRIALYFNSEKDEIEKIINNLFDVILRKEFPIEEKSSGYKATHYRGTIKESVLTAQQQRYVNAKIEIQVASLLMHVWAEVEHDIVYKPLQGQVSKQEKESLDKLNKTVLEGEQILKELQQASLTRNKFNDQYDLANYLSKYISDILGEVECDITIGDTKRLYNYLESNEIATKKKLENRIKDFEVIAEENWTLSDQIMDYILNNKKKNRSYMKSYSYNGNRNIDEDPSIASFLIAWIELEKLLKTYNKGSKSQKGFIRLKDLLYQNVITQEQYIQINKIRIIRNNLVHGKEILESDYLYWYEKEIYVLLHSIENQI